MEDREIVARAETKDEEMKGGMEVVARAEIKDKEIKGDREVVERVESKDEERKEHREVVARVYRINIVKTIEPDGVNAVTEDEDWEEIELAVDRRNGDGCK